MAVPHDVYDITFTTNELEKTEVFELALVDVVANGRLFILNNRGEYEQVTLMTYWKEGNILNVTSKGFEFDEDGETTRTWNL